MLRTCLLNSKTNTRAPNTTAFMKSVLTSCMVSLVALKSQSPDPGGETDEGLDLPPRWSMFSDYRTTLFLPIPSIQTMRETLPRIRGLNYFRSHRSHTSRIQNYFPSSKLAIGCVGCLVALFGLGAFCSPQAGSDLAKETAKSIVLHDVADGNYIPFIELLRAGPFRSAKSLLGMVQHRIL